MLATHSLSLHLSLTPPTRPCSLLSSRPALADSTNVDSHSNACSPTYSKGCIYPTSSARTSCGWNDVESSTGFTSIYSRNNYSSSTPSPFPVTSKAPPTVSISLSAACSQSIPGERVRGPQTQRLEPDLPDVRSVVPFPSAPLEGDADVDMLDGTCVPCSNGYPSAGRAPRKRHSAHSSVSSSQGSLGKDMKPKRPRKSKRQVAELWWLGVVHRSIQRGIEVRRSIGTPDASEGLRSGLYKMDALDLVLVERIQRRLAENGCVEGRALPNPLPRISSPTISVPSLNLVAPSRKTLPTGSAAFAHSSGFKPAESGIHDGTTMSPPEPQAPPCASLSITSQSHSPVPSATPTSHRRHIRFEVPQPLCQLRSSVPRRSPSPPPRTGTISTAQTLTLTMSQLVASLTLAYHERSGLRLRGRTYKVMGSRKNAGRSVFPPPGVQCRDGDATYGVEGLHQSLKTRARLSNAPERKSPLSRVVFAES